MNEQVHVNRRHVVGETIDDETILIHLGTGVYYSLDGVGSLLWALCDRGQQRDELVAALRDAYPGQDGADAAVDALLAQLLAEDLLLAGPDDEGAADSAAPAPAPPAAWTEPKLARYTDMQDFMLVDPLHDVDEEAGWPNVKAG